MDLEEFILNPTDTLQSIAFQRGPIAAYETMEDYARRLGELQLQNASTPMFQTFSQTKADILGSMMRGIVGQGHQLRKIALRKDWLHLQEKAVYILNFIAWMGMFKEQNFGSSLGHWEQCLHTLCQQTGCDTSAKQALEPTHADPLTDNLISVLVHTLDWIQTECDTYKEIENLSPKQLPKISQVLDSLPSNLSESPTDRFAKTQALWDLACGL